MADRSANRAAPLNGSIGLRSPSLFRLGRSGQRRFLKSRLRGFLDGRCFFKTCCFRLRHFLDSRWFLKSRRTFDRTVSGQLFFTFNDSTGLLEQLQFVLRLAESNVEFADFHFRIANRIRLNASDFEQRPDFFQRPIRHLKLLQRLLNDQIQMSHS